jgi:hypothetical protein
MNDNRDVINHGYLPELGGALLNGMISSLSKQALKDIWVLDSIEYANIETKRAYVSRMVPPKHVIKTDSKRANDVCKQNGFELVDIANLPYGARHVLTSYGETATATAEEIDKSTPIKENPALRRKYDATVRLYEWICHQLTGVQYEITFMTKPRAYTGMMTAADHQEGKIRFNTESHLRLDQPLDWGMLSVLTHELAHREGRHEHDDKFHDEVEALAGRLAGLMYRARPHIDELLGMRAAAVASKGSKMIEIKCQKCSKPRLIKPQDVFQVKFCEEHQKEHARARARQRRRERQSEE